jgi:hypothetical protein
MRTEEEEEEKEEDGEGEGGGGEEEEEEDTFFRNVGNHLPRDTESQPGRPEFETSFIT